MNKINAKNNRINKIYGHKRPLCVNSYPQIPESLSVAPEELYPRVGLTPTGRSLSTCERFSRKHSNTPPLQLCGNVVCLVAPTHPSIAILAINFYTKNILNSDFLRPTGFIAIKETVFSIAIRGSIFPNPDACLVIRTAFPFGSSLAFPAHHDIMG